MSSKSSARHDHLVDLQDDLQPDLTEVVVAVSAVVLAAVLAAVGEEARLDAVVF